MTNWINHLLTGIPPWGIYFAVFLLPFLEASVLLGLVIPGETVLIFAGILAAHGGIGLSGVLVLGIAGAILGDSIGYAIGRRYGRPIQVSRLGRLVGAKRWSTAEAFLLRHGPVAIFLGRFAALLRAMVPGIAGITRVPYRTFLTWNVLGGSTWATVAVLGGYALSEIIGTYISAVSYLILLLLLVVVLLHVAQNFARRRRSRRPEKAGVGP